MAEESPKASVDVVRIMKDIRESIQRKREEGILTDEEIADLARVRLRSYADEALIDGKLLDRLLAESHDWNIASDYLIRSHRSGALVALLLAAKRIVRPLVRLYTDHIVNRQAQLNLYFAYLLRHSIHDLTRLETEVAALRSRLQKLEGRKEGPGPGPPPSA